MPERKVTSLHVARRAGVSQSAVSRVFSGASASPQTTLKVRKAAESLGYRPNPLALERLSNALQDQGYHVLVFMAPNDEAAVEKVVHDLMDYQVAGIITASVGMTNDLTERCADAGIPVVMFNRGQDRSGIFSVTSANVAGGARIADFLVAGSCCDICGQ